VTYPLWKFSTKNFTVVWNITDDLDWFGDDKEVQRRIDDGTYKVFNSTVAVLYENQVIGEDHLCGSVYENPMDFRKEHIGAKGKWGSYFRDMVREAISHARDNILNRAPLPYVREEQI